MKILIVDDEKEVTDSLKMELQECSRDLDIITSNSGYDALRLIMQGDVSLVITDIAMPDMDGYELYSRTKEYNSELPIIMMTGFGYDPRHAIVKSRQDGLQDIVYKPFDIGRLYSLIIKRLAGE